MIPHQETVKGHLVECLKNLLEYSLEDEINLNKVIIELEEMHILMEVYKKSIKNKDLTNNKDEFINFILVKNIVNNIYDNLYKADTSIEHVDILKLNLALNIKVLKANV